MELSAIKTNVTRWAASHPIVAKAWIFGSRARNTARSDSDLDVAIEVFGLPGDAEPLATFIFEADELRSSIQALFPFKVDLHWYGGPVETPTIHAGLCQSSVLAYQAG